MHDLLTALPDLLATRARYLFPVLLAGLLMGDPLARALRFPALQAELTAFLTRLGEKLNRPGRSIATRLYRGIIASILLLIPALILGLLLARHTAWVQLLTTLLLTALIGQLMQPWRAPSLARAARRNNLTLQLTTPHFLFPDIHGLLRYYLLAYAHRFACLIGGSVWFLLADMPGLLAYLTLAAAAWFYDPRQPENRAFGWAPAGLFALADALPRLLTCLLLWLGALFTPRTHPWRTLRHFPRRFHGWLAELLGLSLGGPLPGPSGERQLAWAGSGTPRPTATDFIRGLQCLGVAWLVLQLALASAFSY